MTRTLAFALLTAAVASALRADVPVAPPPREVRPDGTRDPAPTPEAVKKESPLEIIDRIVKNSKDVGDKLAMTDTGAETLKKQETILKDIDALLNQDEPPPKSDMNPDKSPDMNPDHKPDPNDQKKDMTGGGGMGGKDMPPMGKGSGTEPPPMGKGGDGGMGQPPMGGGGTTLKERRPRPDGAQKQDAKPKEPGTGGAGQEPKKDQNGGGGQPKEPPKNPKGGPPDSNPGNPPPNPVLSPIEDDGLKQPWGHLPDKVRQQATQYYRQEFSPRYTELLKNYYASQPPKK